MPPPNQCTLGRLRADVRARTRPPRRAARRRPRCERGSRAGRRDRPARADQQAHAGAEERREDRPRCGPSVRCGRSQAAISAVSPPTTRKRRRRRRAREPRAGDQRDRDEREVGDRTGLGRRRDRDDEAEAERAGDRPGGRHRTTGPRLSVRLAVIGRAYGRPSRRAARAAGFGQAGTMAGADRVRVGVLAPMKSELRPVVKAFGLKPAAVGGVAVHTGAVGNADVVATTTGIGTALATSATERLLGLGDFDRVMVVGIAGGVGPTVGIGDLVIPEVVVDGPSGNEYRPAPIDGPAPRGSIVTSDDFIVDPDRLGPTHRARSDRGRHGDRIGRGGVRRPWGAVVGGARDQRPRRRRRRGDGEAREPRRLAQRRGDRALLRPASRPDPLHAEGREGLGARGEERGRRPPPARARSCRPDGHCSPTNGERRSRRSTCGCTPACWLASSSAARSVRSRVTEWVESSTCRPTASRVRRS